ncbi:MAG: MFS transporter, partial [Clostridiales bacterium]|nr:MFS transporter [Clostridiales bacterium]
MNIKQDKGIKTTISMILIYLLMWGGQFTGVNFVPLYVRSLPFSNGMTTGIVMAAGSLVTILALPVWGVLADRAKTKNRVLAVALLGVSALSWLFIIPRYRSLSAILAAVAMFYLFFLAPSSLIDTIVVENIARARLRFSSVKAFASGGAALMAFAVFIISRVYSDIAPEKAFMLMSGCAFLSVFPLCFMPRTSGYARGVSDQGRVSLKSILGNKRLILILAYGLFHFIAVSCVNNFLAIYFVTSDGLNAGMGMYGLFYAISIICEALVMLIGGKFINRQSPYLIFLIAPIA